MRDVCEAKDSRRLSTAPRCKNGTAAKILLYMPFGFPKSQGLTSGTREGVSLYIDSTIISEILR